jgi:GNAT superfamily N-acetyltransferase
VRNVDPVVEPLVRPAVPGDAPAISAVRRASWLAAYDGLIEPDRLRRAAARPASAFNAPSYRRTLVAVAGEPPRVIGYASYGPERMVATAHASFLPSPGPAPTAPVTKVPPGDALPGVLTPAGLAGEVGELYALYADPAWWSAGAGRALMAAALGGLRDAGFPCAVLWTLTANARARRFYEKAGFAPDGAVNILAGLGGVEEVRYARAF